MRLPASHETFMGSCENHKRREVATNNDGTTEKTNGVNCNSAGTVVVSLEKAPLPPRLCTEGTDTFEQALDIWRNKRCSTQPLCEMEREILERIFNDTMPPEKVKLVKIERVQPRTLHAFCCEEQRSLSLEREKKKTHKQFMLLHGTRWGNIQSIKAEGLDPERGRSSKGCWLGHNGEACHAYAAKGPGPAQTDGCRLFAIFVVACVPNVHEGDEERSFGVWRIVSRNRMCPAYLLTYVAPLGMRSRRRRPESPRSLSPFRRSLESALSSGWSQHSRDNETADSSSSNALNGIATQRGRDKLLPGHNLGEMRPLVFSSSFSQRSLARSRSVDNLDLVHDDRCAGQVQVLSARGITRVQATEVQRSCSHFTLSALRGDRRQRYLKSTWASRGKWSNDQGASNREPLSKNRWTWNPLGEDIGVNGTSAQEMLSDNEWVSFCLGSAQQASNPQSMPENTQGSCCSEESQQAASLQSRAEHAVAAVHDEGFECKSLASSEQVLPEQSSNSNTKPTGFTSCTSNISGSQGEPLPGEQRGLLRPAPAVNCAWTLHNGQNVWADAHADSPVTSLENERGHNYAMFCRRSGVKDSSADATKRDSTPPTQRASIAQALVARNEVTELQSLASTRSVPQLLRNLASESKFTPRIPITSAGFVRGEVEHVSAETRSGCQTIPHPRETWTPRLDQHSTCHNHSLAHVWPKACMPKLRLGAVVMHAPLTQGRDVEHRSPRQSQSPPRVSTTASLAKLFVPCAPLRVLEQNTRECQPAALTSGHVQTWKYNSGNSPARAKMAPESCKSSSRTNRGAFGPGIPSQPDMSNTVQYH